MNTEELKKLLTDFLEDIEVEAEVEIPLGKAILDIHLKRFEQALSSSKQEVIEDFAEFCHTKYNGTTQLLNSGDWEYSYKQEVVTMAKEYLNTLKEQ